MLCEQSACGVSLLTAFAIELGTNFGFEVKKGWDVPASHESFAAGYVWGNGCSTAKMMEGNVNRLQVVPRPEDVGA